MIDIESIHEEAKRRYPPQTRHTDTGDVDWNTDKRNAFVKGVMWAMYKTELLQVSYAALADEYEPSIKHRLKEEILNAASRYINIEKSDNWVGITYTASMRVLNDNDNTKEDL